MRSPTTTRMVMAVLLGLLWWAGAAREALGATPDLRGAGATFPLPFYRTVFEHFSRQQAIPVQYQGVGSGQGIRLLQQRKVDFGGTDAFMTAAEQKAARGAITHLPTTLGAVAVTYSLPGNPQLRLTPEAIADIFRNAIKRWDDPRLTALNPAQRLPDLPIRVVHRADSSGTTHIFTEYLSKTSPSWKAQVGSGKMVTWPVGIGGEGNPGVAGLIRQATGSIGYVELIYALANGLTVAEVRNRSGRFLAPDPTSVTLAAKVPIPPDTNASLTDTEAPDGYPISGFTWLAVYQEQDYDGRPREQAEALAKLLWWVTHEGQVHAGPLHYAPLPDEAVRKAELLLRGLTHKGHALLR